ncbi:OmpH family outer membrane protein [Sphingomonas lenta]|nr:OmpH family outer membrane protein [Sphingomonas lenta]
MTSKNLMLAAAFVAPAAVAAPAQAQVAGIAIADAEGAIQRSRAFQTAVQQIQTQYKTQLDQANTRRQALQNELQPLITAYQNATRAPNATQASVAPAAQALQTRERAAQQELARLTEPAQRAQAYVVEQIARQLNTAVQNAVKTRNVQLLLTPQAALFAQPAADLTPAIVTELDRLVPSVGITPPAGWQPGQAGQQAAAPAATTPAPAQPASNQRRNQGR